MPGPCTMRCCRGLEARRLELRCLRDTNWAETGALGGAWGNSHGTGPSLGAAADGAAACAGRSWPSARLRNPSEPASQSLLPTSKQQKQACASEGSCGHGRRGVRGYFGRQRCEWSVWLERHTKETWFGCRQPGLARLSRGQPAASRAMRSAADETHAALPQFLFLPSKAHLFGILCRNVCERAEGGQTRCTRRERSPQGDSGVGRWQCQTCLPLRQSLLDCTAIVLRGWMLADHNNQAP